MKHCNSKYHVDNNPLPISSFNKRKISPDGLQPFCKECCSKIAKAAYQNRLKLQGKDRLRSYHTRSLNGERVTHEQQLERDRINRRLRIEKSPQHNLTFLLREIKCRCRKNNIPFNVSVKDFTEFPTHCPDLRVPLIYGNKAKASPHSATVDRIIPELGYVSGNVRIISYRANVMKQNASLEEMKTIAESWLRLYNESVLTNQAATQTALTGENNDV